MYPISPVYANRQYASVEGTYKVHAVSKNSPLHRSGEQTLFDMIMAYNDYVRSPEERHSTRDNNGSAGSEQRRKRSEPAGETGSAPAGANSPVRNGGGRPVVTDAYLRTAIISPPDGASISRPFSPYGRFRELGFDAEHLPARPVPAVGQRLYDSMLSAYAPYRRIGMNYEERS
ncbi:hypothetical protein ACFFK0_22725 [Paenibacillus chartarius]|uniref:Uncharacterized protein n=1 Tax=Paenibacillus chartarius TaxID=747481 RepID=A0ABV6DRD3_9BACL